MKLYFATIFDINYLSRGLLLLKTLRQHHDNFTLFVICLDQEVEEYFQTNICDEIRTIQISEIETEFPELLAVKATRNKIDYIFTLSPFYPSYIIKRNPEIPFICSLDADLYFFGNCESVFDDLDRHSVLITPHRFSKRLKGSEKFGKYNVSFQVFKNDEVGNACLYLWRNQCLAWCKDELENDKYADQKYLDGWAEAFGTKVKPIADIGIGLAPWNLEDVKLRLIDNRVFVEDYPLRLYHYQGLRFLSDKVVDSGLYGYSVRASHNFKVYILKKIISELAGFQHHQKDTISRYRSETNPRSLFEKIKGYDFFYKRGDQIFSLNAFFYIKKILRSLWRK